MRGDQRLQPLDAVAVEPVERLIEQPQVRTGGGDARRASRAWPARSTATAPGHPRARQGRAPPALLTIGGPLIATRTSMRAPTAVRGRARAPRRQAPRALDPPALGAEQAGGEPDQARLAAAIGAAEVERVARRELEVEPFEQQPPAAPQGHLSNRSRASCHGFLERVHVVVGKAEMMADLVDQDVRDEMLEAVLAVGPFIEDRAAEQADSVGQCAGVRRRFSRSAACLRKCRSGRTGRRCPSSSSVSSSAKSSTSRTTSPRWAAKARAARPARAARAPRSRRLLARVRAAHRRGIGAGCGGCKVARWRTCRPKWAPFQRYAERWPSGRRRSPGK